MTRRLGRLLMVTLCACPLASADELSERDVVFLHSQAPVFIRLQIVVEGQDFTDRWRKTAASAFRTADKNGDGRITRDEQPRTPSNGDPLEQALRARDLWVADSLPPDSAISPNEFERFVDSRQFGALQQTPMVRGSDQSAIGTLLFTLLDADHNGLITGDEFRSAARRMRRVDFDDNGAYSVQELSAAANASGTRRPQTVSSAAFALLSEHAPPTSITRELRRRYGPRRNEGVDFERERLGLSDKRSSRYDIDRSGNIDQEELRALLRDPPVAVALRIEMDSNGRNGKTTLISHDPKRVSVREADNLLSIVVKDVQIEVGCAPSEGGAARRLLQQQFRQADTDNNNYLEEKEVQRFPVFSSSFSEFDADSDGKLFEKEMLALIQTKSEVAATRTRLGIRNGGRDLFQILDRDRNLAISHAELTEAGRRIALWDNNDDGAVAANEVPQLFQLSLGPGQPEFPELRPGLQSNSRRNSDGAPDWFVKMDRNRDGELSRREFPGTTPAFEKLDKNNDSVVDQQEAVDASK